MSIFPTDVWVMHILPECSDMTLLMLAQTSQPILALVTSFVYGKYGRCIPEAPLVRTIYENLAEFGRALLSGAEGGCSYGIWNRMDPQRRVRAIDSTHPSASRTDIELTEVIRQHSMPIDDAKGLLGMYIACVSAPSIIWPTQRLWELVVASHRLDLFDEICANKQLDEPGRSDIWFHATRSPHRRVQKWVAKTCAPERDNIALYIGHFDDIAGSFAMIKDADYHFEGDEFIGEAFRNMDTGTFEQAVSELIHGGWLLPHRLLEVFSRFRRVVHIVPELKWLVRAGFYTPACDDLLPLIALLSTERANAAFLLIKCLRETYGCMDVWVDSTPTANFLITLQQFQREYPNAAWATAGIKVRHPSEAWHDSTYAIPTGDSTDGRPLRRRIRIDSAIMMRQPPYMQQMASLLGTNEGQAVLLGTNEGQAVHIGPDDWAPQAAGIPRSSTFGSWSRREHIQDGLNFHPPSGIPRRSVFQPWQGKWCRRCHVRAKEIWEEFTSFWECPKCMNTF